VFLGKTLYSHSASPPRGIPVNVMLKGEYACTIIYIQRGRSIPISFMLLILGKAPMAKESWTDTDFMCRVGLVTYLLLHSP